MIRIKKSILVLIMLFCFCGTVNAEAAGIRDVIGFIGNQDAVHYTITTEIIKMPQYDSARTEQLNRLIRHFSLDGMINEKMASMTVLLDNKEIFTAFDDEAAYRRIYSFPDQNQSFFVPSEEEKTEEKTNLKIFEVFSDITENRNTYIFMDRMISFFSKLPNLFPEKCSSIKVNEKYKDYGTAVQKITIRISAEEMTECIRDFCRNDSSELSSYHPEDLVFSGRQDFELLINDRGGILKIRYGGTAGLSEEDLRTVRLEWKTIRSEETDRDELSLRTPNSGGTKRNNFLLEHTRKMNEDGSESFLWKAEKDILAEGIRSREMTNWSAKTTGACITGLFTVDMTTKGNQTGKEIKYDISIHPSDHYSGILEIISKKDKIENGQFNVFFDLSKETAEMVKNQLSEMNAARETYSGIQQRLARTILAELVQFPAEDLGFLIQDIPEELLEKILKE